MRAQALPSALCLQPVEGLPFHPLLVAPDQISDVLTDILVGSILAYICGNEITERTADTDRHSRGSSHGAILPLAADVFNIIKNEYVQFRGLALRARLARLGYAVSGCMILATLSPAFQRQ